MSRPVVIVNPNAGAGASAEELRDRLGFLRDPEVRETQSAGDARSIAAEAVEQGASAIVAVGGDGTLNEVVNGMASGFGWCRLGVVPAGTGNDTARSLGLPLDLEAAIRHLADAVERGPARSARVDLIEVELDGVCSWALNTATGGFGGAVNEEMTEDVRDLWGPLAYARAAASVANEPPVHDVVVSIDGRGEEALSVISLVVANGSVAAHGIPVAPEASMWDGRLAVHAVLETGLVERLAIAAALLGESVPDHEAYRSWACERVTVRCLEGFPVSLDGELADATEMRYRVAPSALTILGVTRGG